MLLIVSIMIAGILTGFIWVARDKSGKLLKIFGKVQQIATMLQLFVIGMWLGGNPEFWRDAKIIGFHGFLFASVTIASSVVAVYFAAKMFKEEEER